MDDLSLCRAIELLEYWRREAKAQLDAMKQTGRKPSVEEDIEVPEFNQPDEDTLTGQFNAMPRANAMQPGFDQNISRIPQHLRDMIMWAEEVKAKRGLN